MDMVAAGECNAPVLDGAGLAYNSMYPVLEAHTRG